MTSPVFNRVRAAACNRAQYTPELHQRVDALVDEWYHETGAMHLYPGQRKACEAYVCGEYRKRYGNPLVMFILWPIISSIVSWLVQKTLDELFAGSMEDSE